MPMRPWTEAELATLAELAETFVRGGAVRRAGLAADALTAAADPEQIAQLRLVLRIFESRAANLALTGRRTVVRPLSARYDAGPIVPASGRQSSGSFPATRKRTSTSADWLADVVT